KLRRTAEPLARLAQPRLAAHVVELQNEIRVVVRSLILHATRTVSRMSSTPPGIRMFVSVNGVRCRQCAHCTVPPAFRTASSPSRNASMLRKRTGDSNQEEQCRQRTSIESVCMLDLRKCDLSALRYLGGALREENEAAFAEYDGGDGLVAREAAGRFHGSSAIHEKKLENRGWRIFGLDPMRCRVVFAAAVALRIGDEGALDAVKHS